MGKAGYIRHRLSWYKLFPLICFSILGIVSLVACGRSVPDLSQTTYIGLATTPSMNPYSYAAHITADRKVLYGAYTWGTDLFSSDATGNLVSVASVQSEISQDEYEQLIKALEDNQFMNLPETIDTKDLMDGAEIYIKVDADDKVHTAGGYMPQLVNKRFNAVWTCLNTILDEHNLPGQLQSELFTP